MLPSPRGKGAGGEGTGPQKLAPRKTHSKSHLRVDLWPQLLYNLATPRYEKVFFPKLSMCRHELFEGVGLPDFVV